MTQEEIEVAIADLKEMEEYLQKNAQLYEKINSKSVMLYLLAKINDIEKRLKVIEYNTKTHWAE